MAEQPDRPILKEPVWIWSVPAYFFVGGAAGAAATLGATAQALAPEMDALTGRCRKLAFAGSVVSTGLLIVDLGRPERFLNMLRVFRPTSALSVGSWVLTNFGAASGAAVMGPRSMRPAASISAGALGLPMTTYTAAVLANTAVPVWKEMRKPLPFLFASSSLSTATAALELSGELSAPEERVVHRLGAAAKVAELAASFMVARQVDKKPRVAKPLREGLSGSLWKASIALTAAGLALSMSRSNRVRKTGAAAGALGSLALRFSVFHAGRASTRDRHAVLDPEGYSPS